MNIANAFYIVLKDEYTEQDLERTRTIMESLSEFVVIDERSDWNRATVPMEEAAMELYKNLVKKEKAIVVPGKIEIKKEVKNDKRFL